MVGRRKGGWPKGRPRKTREEPTTVVDIIDEDRKDDKPIPRPMTFDIATLGTRTGTRMVEKPVVVGKTDLGKDVITMKMVPVTVTKLQPILNLEETLSLGERDWRPFPPKDNHWACFVESAGQRRRFLIPDEIYRKIKNG